MTISIKNTTQKKIPRVPFKKIGNRVLGKKYELSLVFCGDFLSRKLNSTYRKKDTATNVLSFELTLNSGEIFINLSRTKDFNPLHLFIHGLMHLKGMRHGRKMNQAEKQYLNGTTNSSWYRHRNL